MPLPEKRALAPAMASSSHARGDDATTERVSQPFDCVGEASVNIGTFNLGLMQNLIESKKSTISLCRSFGESLQKALRKETCTFSIYARLVVTSRAYRNKVATLPALLVEHSSRASTAALPPRHTCPFGMKQALLSQVACLLSQPKSLKLLPSLRQQHWSRN